MKNKIVLFIAILSIITLFQNCSNDELILNEDYLTVSDIFLYCRCKCNTETFPCEDKEVKIKGHFYSDGFNNFNNDDIIEMPVTDIRNGYSIPIIFSSNDTAIINKILSSNETDICYIKGIVKPMQINSGFTCTLEAKIILNIADDFFYKK
jgi:hypothetical protein